MGESRLFLQKSGRKSSAIVPVYGIMARFKYLTIP
jgi:hypothetical protein